ncbi:MAG: hypothetical protein AAFR59_10795 [Bacteroidota bacterium]
MQLPAEAKGRVDSLWITGSESKRHQEKKRINGEDTQAGNVAAMG